MMDSHDDQDDQSVPIQDAAREELMRNLLGLMPSGEGRSGADAIDEQSHPFELKSTTKDGVSTARDVGAHTLAKWRTRYWICAKGRNPRTGFELAEVYFLHPSFLEEWLAPMQSRFDSDLSLLDRVLAALPGREFTSIERKRLEYLVRRGYTINNPHIPWHYIQSHGIKIERDFSIRLRELVRQYPLQP